MSVAGVSAVRARMDAIESRFGSFGPAPGAIGAHDVAGTVTGFGDSLRSALGVDALTVGGSDDHPPPARTSTATRVDGTSVAVAAPPAGDHSGRVAPGTPFAQEFEAAAARHGVPARLLAAVGWVESGYRPEVVSPAGAIGLMQIMPMTANELGVDPTDPVQAIDGAARLLAAHRDRFGSWDLALAAYHSGAGAVARAGNSPPPRAAEYVRRVNERLDSA